MEYLYKTYIKTIDPENDYKVLMDNDVCSSIAIHFLIYIMSYKFLSMSLGFPDRSINISFILILIMSLGYYFRLARAKSIYNYYLKKGFNKKRSKQNAMKQINNAYFVWYFLA